MLALFLLYALLVSSSHSQKRCCVDKQFSAILADPSDIARGSYQFSHIAEDFEAKLLATTTFQFSPGNSSIPLSRVVQDFNQGIQYVIYSDKCTSQKLQYTMQGPCVPDDAEFLGSNIIGYQPKTLNINGYRWKFANQEAYIAMTFSDDCTPLVESIIGTINGGPVDRTYIFNQYQKTITDRSIFNIPATCTTST
ncbi:hypothetical protein SNE40_018481 [Patella caerulea]|uniref:Uncharacterized protein n=1 Tax=Patella caerulea TaxID=87958 RepID=A0AAN8J5N3_PATCE